MPAGELRVGEQVVELGGRTATIAALAVRPGAATYYNLTVSTLHTYAVGTSQAVVHNSNCTGGSGKAPRTPDGKYALRNGEPGRDGAADEQLAHEHLILDGANVRREQTMVSAPGFPKRFYDGTVEIDGEWYGIETKGATGSKKTLPKGRLTIG